VILVFDSSYTGGIDRRMEVGDQPGLKSKRPYLKNSKITKSKKCCSNDRMPV
jgi:hypothetical protein